MYKFITVEPLSNLDTNGAEEVSLLVRCPISEVEQEWYLGWEKVSCLERCPQFMSVLIERERERGYTVFNCLFTVNCGMQRLEMS